MVGVQLGAAAPPPLCTEGVSRDSFRECLEDLQERITGPEGHHARHEKGEGSFFLGRRVGMGKRPSYDSSCVKSDARARAEFSEAGRELTELSKFRCRSFAATSAACSRISTAPNKTVCENVAFALESSVGRVDRGSPGALILDLVGLSDKSKSLPATCPVASQQRVAVARRLVNRPLICSRTNQPATSTGELRVDHGPVGTHQPHGHDVVMPRTTSAGRPNGVGA